jgi:hypothetical protein
MLRRAALVLILGFVTTIAVAGSVGWSGLNVGQPEYFETTLKDQPESYIVTRGEAFGRSFFEELEWVKSSATEPRTPSEIRRAFKSADWKATPHRDMAWSLGGPNGSALMVEWGWPMRCVWGAAESLRDTHRSTSFGLFNYRGQLNPTTTYSIEVPYAPIPLGLVVNCIVWATAWWVLIFAPAGARRYFRHRRGHCPHCNYDFRATPPGSPCPECGTPRPPIAEHK